jgi:predicted lipoprotein with Yx(FWY)xxD motif
MTHKITLFIAIAALSAATLVAAAAGSAGSASLSRAPKGAMVGLRATALGRILVDARGRTLYRFEKDRNGRSACNGACAVNWPPLISAGKARPGSGLRASLLGLTRRSDGRRQVTYAGHPLYTFVADMRAGQTAGEGVKAFGGSWDALAASGRAVEPPSGSPSGNSGGTGGGYGGYGGYGYSR